MKEKGVKDTAAFRVIRQVVDHTWSSDEEVSDEDVVTVCRDFVRRGGSWKDLMSGDVRAFQALESSIQSMFEVRELSRIARKIVNDPPAR
jgi:hypothetical protein